MTDYKFISIVDSNLDLVLSFCKWCEQTFDIDTLTGINFAHTNDAKFVLGLSFQDNTAWEKAFEQAKLNRFEVCNDIEQEWTTYQTIAKFIMLGNFSYTFAKNYLKGDNQ